jgi:signal transduction histidine kinase
MIDEMEAVAERISAYNVLLINKISQDHYETEWAYKKIDDTEIRYERTAVKSIVDNNIKIESKKQSLGDYDLIVPESVIYLSGYPVAIDDEVHKVLLVFSERSFDEAEQAVLEKLAEKLQTFLIDLEIQEAMADEQFFANIGRMSAGYMHEINNEMSVLQNQLESMRLFLKSSGDTLSKSDVRNHERDVRSAFNNLRRVNDLFLNTVRRERPEELDLIDTTRRIVNIFVAEKDIPVRFEYDKSHEWHLRIPPFPYEQALKNILLNATYHLEGISYGRIDINFRIQDAQLQVTISDNGRGMHATTRRRLFTPRTSKKKGGKGMGLYLSKIMLESIGGDVECTETYMYGGSRFKIILPIVLEGGDA